MSGIRVPGIPDAAPSKLQGRFMTELAIVMIQGGLSFFAEHDVDNFIFPRIARPFVRPGIESLFQGGFLKEGRDESGELVWQFTPRGADYLYDIDEINDSSLFEIQRNDDNELVTTQTEIQRTANDANNPPFGIIDSVPDSDRFVPLNHNSHEYQEAKASIHALAEAVRGSNDLFADPNQRLLVVSEIEEVGKYLDHPIVRVATIWSTTRLPAVIGWLSKEASSGIIRDFAVKAIKALLAVVGHPAP